MNRRDVAWAALGWVLLCAPPLGIVLAVWWAVRHLTGWDMADALVSLILIGWVYWLTSTRQRDRDEIDAHGRRLEELHQAVWADGGAEDAEPDTDEIPVQPGPRTEPMAVVDVTPATQARREQRWDDDAAGLVVDVELARVLAGFEDSIWSWKHNREVA